MRAAVIHRFLIIAALVAGTLGAAEQRGSVTSAGLPIPGAIITATLGDVKLVTSTDDSGSYVFEDLGPGAWTIEIQAFGFEKTKRIVNVPAGAALTWELKLGAPQPRPPEASAPPGDISPWQSMMTNCSSVSFRTRVMKAALEALSALANIDSPKKQRPMESP